MNGDTAQFADQTARDGTFVRQRSRFTDRISADGPSGVPAEPGRYHLCFSLACPWVHGQLIERLDWYAPHDRGAAPATS